MGRRFLLGCVFVCFVFVIAGYVVLGWTPDQRVGYGVMAFGIVVLILGFLAGYMAD